MYTIIITVIITVVVTLLCVVLAWWTRQFLIQRRAYKEELERSKFHTIHMSDFALFPGGRYVSSGNYSAEVFRDDILIPALNEHKNIRLDLDNVVGYASCFLEELFGGLVRKGFTKEEIDKRIKLVSIRNSLFKEIDHYLTEASKNTMQSAS